MSKKLLIVGPIARWQRAKRQLPEIEGIAFADFSTLTSDVLRDEAPEVIVSALVSEGFDATDLARLLTRLRYTGIYRAVTEELVSPAVVLAEVAAIAPDLDFDVFQIDGQGG